MKTYQGNKIFRVGKIVNTQGIKGELRIVPVTDFPDRFQRGEEFIVEDAKGQQFVTIVESARPHKNFILLKFKDMNSINDVEKWKGGELFVTEENLAPLEEGEYYFHQLIGLQVYTEDQVHVGTLDDILQTGANDVYVVKRPGQKDLLLPVIDECIREVNLDKNQIIVYIMPGLE
ncbi:hypothetical protein BHU72_03135 [Desulfuribacillus stibiiarsenatis]|uniref:Ribosome maturation factor RimM n=1 Tax=Desulfuribacillus stibiiarsenatis TaxID=1390249 RepID=A0A1E5L6N5_9FIRM|nr:ribosome maturation factor RimM [Desulfuribacillus stibiiarsenatis]OEH85791.1 hypothetical protein BHU72_03135 [Desulfuribacillus stibiiarsenatis]